MNIEKLQCCAEMLTDVELGLVLINLLHLKKVAIGYYKMKQRQMGEDNGYDKL